MDDRIGSILSWLAIATAVAYIAYNWVLVARARKLRPQYASAIAVGTGLLIFALPMQLYPNLSPAGLNQIFWLAVAAIVVAVLIDFPLKRGKQVEREAME